VPLVLTLVCSVLYPLAVTGAAQLAFPGRVNGCETTDASGNDVGSERSAGATTCR
jgi:K+-transporting ATPase ATPase C chain